MTIPLVFAVAGNGTWLAYLLATFSVLLVALCICSFARHSASPGSLYSYAMSTLPPAVGALTAWALLAAYIATGSSVIGGFVNYGMVVLQTLTPYRGTTLLMPVGLAIFVTALSVFIAYRDVRISTRLMLWIEGTSALLIAIVLAAIFLQHGLHFDLQQLRLQNASVSGIRLGMVLALFSFVGFESATTLGSEAREPLRTIPLLCCNRLFSAGSSSSWRPMARRSATALQATISARPARRFTCSRSGRYPDPRPAGRCRRPDQHVRRYARLHHGCGAGASVDEP